MSAKPQAAPLRLVILAIADQELRRRLPLISASIEDDPDPLQRRGQELRFGFLCSSFHYAATVTPKTDGHHLRILTKVGRVPYSAEDQHRRNTIRTLLQVFRRIGPAQLVLGVNQVLWCIFDEDRDGWPNAEDLTLDCLRFVHHTGPVPQMVRSYLD